MKHGKKYRAALAKYDLTKKYDVASACKMVQDMKFANFDETVEAHVVLRLEKTLLYVIHWYSQISSAAKRKFWFSVRKTK